MKVRRNNDQLLKAVVARKTRGSAFLLDHDKYCEQQDRVRAEVKSQLETLSRSEFIKLNIDYLWDEK